MRFSFLLSSIFCLLFSAFCFSQTPPLINFQDKTSSSLKTGAEQTGKYFPLIKGKSIVVVAHPASMIKDKHLVDTLLKSGMKVKKIFAPEHGFRGDSEAGEKIYSGKDEKTGLPVISLYGNHFKPKPDELKDVDVVLFDLQDVGARFYTYITTLHYVMEACAENKKQLIVLDRPNPNGHYADGPVLEPKYKSFSGMHPVPIVYGMTIGEYAQMLNGEGWLAGGIKCNLKVIPVEDYSHKDLYQLPVKPSPNLPDMSAVYLYPSLCLFEGTMVSVGRGTDKPFQQFGYPALKGTTHVFTPVSIKGVSEEPLYKEQLCYGYDVSRYGEVYIKFTRQLHLFWLINLYKRCESKENFFNDYFDFLAGNETLRKQIISGMEEEEIRKTWQDGLKKFKEIRKKYLLYADAK